MNARTGRVAAVLLGISESHLAGPAWFVSAIAARRQLLLIRGAPSPSEQRAQCRQASADDAAVDLRIRPETPEGRVI